MSVLESLETDQIDYYFASDTWRKLAACKGMPPREFHPKRGADQEELHVFCGSCMVQTECLIYALLRNEDFGFWGNHSERARRQIRKRLRKTRPDLLKAGAQLAGKQRKGLHSKLAKSVRGINEEVEAIDEGELMEHLLPKVRDMIRRIAQRQGTVNTEQLMLGLNISAEAFFQRLSLARQLEWVCLEGENLRLTRKGREQLDDSGTPVTFRFSSNQPTAHQEVEVRRTKPGELSELDQRILARLNKGDIEDGANASGVLAEELAVGTGPSYTNRLKRLEGMKLIERAINGRRTTRIAITALGKLQLHSQADSERATSTNGHKPSSQGKPTRPSEEVEGRTKEVAERLIEQLEGTRQIIDTVHTILAENDRLRERYDGMVVERDEARAALATSTEELDELKEELERLRPLADRYSQMQELLQP